MATHGRSSATPATEAHRTTRLRWHTAEVIAVRDETARARSLVLRVEGWSGHLAGQHVDVRLTAADGYQAQRSYSIASAPQASQLELLVDRIPDGEVSPYLTQDVRPGDRFELRGPIGGYFVWTAAHGGPLLLIGGGSGIVPFAGGPEGRPTFVSPHMRDAPAPVGNRSRRHRSLARTREPSHDAPVP